LIVNQSPTNFGIEQSRWQLSTIQQVCVAVKSYTLMGLCLVLRRFGLRHLRGRHYVHSPDTLYNEKLAYIQQIIKSYNPQTERIYFMDQLTVYMHPSVGYDWVDETTKQPLARRGYKADQTFRICGAIDCFDGEVETLIQNKISVPALISFFTTLSQKNPEMTNYVITDNWPNHVHPDLMAALQPQKYPFGYILPPSWKDVKPKKKYMGKNIPVQLVFLPTYASWLNPIEKLWRWLKQDLIHLHRCTDNFKELKEKVTDWLNKPEHQKRELLFYVGLLKENGIFDEAINYAKSNISKNV
jgi:hypothetical protein